MNLLVYYFCWFGVGLELINQTLLSWENAYYNYSPEFDEGLGLLPGSNVLGFFAEKILGLLIFVCSFSYDILLNYYY